MAELEVLRDAAADLLAAASRADVADVVRRAVCRLTSDGTGRPVFADLAPPVSTPPPGAVQRGALLLDQGTAGRGDLAVVLEVLGNQAALALDRVCRGPASEPDRDQFDSLVEQITDVILILDEQDRIRYASPSARTLLGTSALRDVRLTDLVAAPERRHAIHLLRHVRQVGGEADGVGARADWTMHASDGRVLCVEVSCRDMRVEESVAGVVVTLRDVTRQRRLEHELTEQLFRDELTALPNRLFLYERASEALAAGAGVTGLLLVDLDDFRAVNEALGRETGDAVMQAVAARLRDTAGPDHVTARLPGDEFAVLVADAPDAGMLGDLAGRLTEALRAPILGCGTTLTCTGSVGVATTADAGTVAELLRQADLALTAAKAAGKRCWRRYDPTTSTVVSYRLELRSQLQHALHDESLFVQYQPIVALDTDCVVGWEALVRWRHPTRGVLSPGEFIDIAEESGLILQLGEQVLTTAIGEARQWGPTGPGGPPYVSVNVSVQQFQSSGFIDTIHRLLADLGLPPSRLVLEITESLLLRDDDKVWDDLKRLRERGIRVAIDDFGTGYSALGYLRQVPLDIVKLDRIFISTMATSARQRELVRGIVHLARTLGLTVVAEGIETRRQRDISLSAGCGYGQGYLFARPMSAEQAAAWMSRHGRQVGS
jgi:diguanylate cyclase (GGDEF)-like protein/PAS domain S-box-containing protein